MRLQAAYSSCLPPAVSTHTPTRKPPSTTYPSRAYTTPLSPARPACLPPCPQVELFCISKLINCVLETDEEFVCMDFHFAVS